MNLCPDHLKSIVNGDFSKINIPDKEWFDECHWKGKLCFNGIEKFKIYFSGETIENYLVNNDDEAFIIKVLPVGTNEKITIFDERYHGYNALLIENLLNKKYTGETIFMDKDGKNIFEIILVANYNIDFEDEYQNKETLELINGETETIENIRRNAFDFFGIIIKNELGNVYNVLEMELV
ncbi:MAG: hypothetical protein LBL00_02620 [Endomicrobium sp.]|jgi:hypothetical protein|nr:hypothetical protein [Endomicrobium sp.]